MKLLIRNAHLLTPFKEISAGQILIEDGKILEVSSGLSSGNCDRLLDVEGRVVSPGFIDVHVQGAGGCDVLDGSKEALRTISGTCIRFGVTGFLATTVFRPRGNNRHLTAAACSTGKEMEGADLLGIHLEGPFISPEKRGMIKPDCLGEARNETLERILELTGDSLKMMTAAPELPGCPDLIRRLRKEGAIASFGHSAADYRQTREGIEAGLNHVTHLFNAMQPIHHRQPGPLPAILETEGITAQVILDGVHIHPSVLKMVLPLLGPERLVIITDGMQAMGLPEGEYVYNGLPYKTENGTAFYSDGTLIGTALGMNRLVQRCMHFNGGSLLEAVRAASYNPARLLGLEERKGSIAVGKDADLVFLNPNLSVWKTMKRGKFCYEANPS
jgi:N-acetylglucosamine-6-phosphate deacetylase